VKITDFGTAKILQFGTMQQTAHVMGTPSYMSPEQVKGRAVDGRSDIFSLGVLLYEMVTGEKPFPGQNITTVIYKIVNEEPVPPRQIDPSIHPGISAVVMKALAKEPEARYQSCREMLEDLRNYRSIAPGGSPDKTMVAGGMAGMGAPNATLPLGGTGAGAQGGRSFHAEDPMTVATTRSLNARASSPTQTPAVRRTGPITPLAPVEEPKKKSVIGSIFIALVLIGVIAYGVQKLRPVIEDARQINAAQKSAANDSATTPAPTDNGTNPTPAGSAGNETPAGANPDVAAPEKKATEAPVEKSAPKKSEPVVTAQAAEYKGRIEEAISEKGLTGRAKVQAIGNTLVLAGKLRPAEHGALLKFLRDAPTSVRVVDHIEYEDAPVAENGHDADGGHPVPTQGRGAIHVVTDLIGATAVLRGPAGRVVNQCQTPCSFNDLGPAQYSLEVQKEGYQPMQTALQVKAGNVIDQKVTLESLAKGLLLTSHPAGADVFINGAKQSGQTPVTLPLAPGSYNLVLRMPGYDAYAGSVQVKDNIQTQLDVPLKEKSNVKVAWADVETNPKGAEVFVDGQTTGQMTPARVQVPVGVHTVTVKLNGYQVARRTFQATEGGTVNITNVTLQPK
jgi:hypothetical protein